MSTTINSKMAIRVVALKTSSTVATQLLGRNLRQLDLSLLTGAMMKRKRQLDSMKLKPKLGT